MSGDKSGSGKVVMVPVEAWDWLFGLGDSFDPPAPTDRQAKYWWRSEFRRRIRELGGSCEPTVVGSAVGTNLLERTAQIAAHRACCGDEHDTANGKLHGYCVVCGVPWPCQYAGVPPEALPEGLSFKVDADAVWLVAKAGSCTGMLNLGVISQHHPDGPIAKAFKAVCDAATSARSASGDRK